jgi:hypothetical protein
MSMTLPQLLCEATRGKMGRGPDGVAIRSGDHFRRMMARRDRRLLRQLGIS